MSEAHNTGEIDNFSCISCAQQFGTKPSLIRHRLNAHGKSKIKCRNKANGNCKWGAIDEGDCLYDHRDSDQPDKTSKLQCNSCEELFSFQSQFLKHRKSKHQETVPECKTITEGKICPFGNRCGFDHTNKMSQSRAQVSINKVNHEVNKRNGDQNTNKTSTNFWEARQNANPPDQMKEITNMMNKMMTDIAQLKEQQKLTSKN